MPTTGPVQDFIRERRKQKKKALAQLNVWKQDKITLKRPVFFVPGWTDEDCKCWKFPYRKGYIPIKEWISTISKNPKIVHYIVFSEKGSKRCKSFFDFADILKGKIWRSIGKRKSFDLVGHSMGGLDSVAAIIDKDKPLTNVYNLVTVATPHQGSELGEIGPIFRRYKPHHAIQCINLDPDQLPIKFINKLEVRKTLIERINKLYCLMGTRDMAVMRSARFNKEGLNRKFYKKKVKLVEEFGGATHSQKFGITLDPRATLSIIQILLDIKLPKSDFNYGYIFRKV